MVTVPSFYFALLLSLYCKEQTAPASVLTPALLLCNESCPDQIVDPPLHRPARELQFPRYGADGRITLSLLVASVFQIHIDRFCKPPQSMPLFLPFFLTSHPFFSIRPSLGGTFFSRTALPGGVNRARGLFKATRPLTCTQFAPAIFCLDSRFPWPSMPAFPAIPQSLSNRPKQAKKRSCRSSYPLFPENGSNRLTGSHTGRIPPADSNKKRPVFFLDV